MRVQGAYSLTIEIANISPNIELLFRDLHPTLHNQARKMQYHPVVAMLDE
jgi:hypothetical protein